MHTWWLRATAKKRRWEGVAALFKSVTLLPFFGLGCRRDESHCSQHFSTTQSELNSQVKTSKPRCKSYLGGLMLFLYSPNPPYRINPYALKGRRGEEGQRVSKCLGSIRSRATTLRPVILVFNPTFQEIDFC